MSKEKKKSAQDSIPFERMWQDGICRVKPDYFTKTVMFRDINYQLNQNEDETAIFDGWCDFLNYFDSSVHFQLSFMNLAANKDTYADSIAIPPRDDDFDGIRTEYTEMLRGQLANRIFIYFRDPSAGHVAGYRARQDKFGRHVVKGAKGIQILAPTPFKKKVEEEKLAPIPSFPCSTRTAMLSPRKKR